MGGVVEVLDKLPSWAGNVPVWALLVIVVGTLVREWIKNRPVMEQQKIDERLNIKTGYKETIARLEKQVQICHEESRQRERELQNEIDQLKERLNNEAWQRTQSEISLVTVLMDVVEAPQLRTILEALQAKQKADSAVRYLGKDEALGR